MSQLLINMNITMRNLIVTTSIIVTIFYVLFKIPRFIELLIRKKKKLIWKMVFTLILIIVIIESSEYSLNLVAGGARVNIRDSIAILSVILLGPIEGMIVVLIGGLYRMSIGGWTAIPCGLATISIGIITAYITRYKGYKIQNITLRQIKNIAILTGIWEVVHTMVYCTFLGTKPFYEAFNLMLRRAVFPMVIANIMAITIFLLICRDAIVKRYSIIRKEEYRKKLEKEVADRTSKLNANVKALKEGQEKYKAIINNSNSRISIVNSDYEIKFINDEWLKHVTYNADWPCYKVFEGLNKPCDDCHLNKVINEGKTIYIDKIFPDETIGSMYITPIKNASGDISEIMSISYDITKRKKAEKALTNEREWLETTLKSIADGVLTTDTNKKITLFNDMAEKLTGWSRKNALGKSLTEVFHIIDGNTGEIYRDPVEEVLRFRNVINYIDNIILLMNNGKSIFITASCNPIYDKNGNISGVVLIFRDITNQKRMEEEVQKSMNLESIGILAGGIAHDFNNILAAILGNTSMGKMDIKPESKCYKRLIEIEKASMQAKDLTQQLLTFSKGGAPIKETASISGRLKDTANFVLSGSPSKAKFSIPTDCWNVDIDKGQISQVINNIVINANQSMPEGGIINIDVENQIITEDANLPIKTGKYVKISIKDKGIGIKKEHLNKVFDPYFTTKQKGNGLGLSSAYSIMKKHNGYIYVESEIGKGSTFYIYLPAAEQKPLKSNESNKNIQKGEGRILVMDDEKIIRKVCGEILETLGYNVEFASNGNEAIAIYNQNIKNKTQFSAIIMDLTISGGMGGKETIKKILEIDPNAKVIVSSGYSNDTVMANYSDYGFKGVLTKPYNIEDISNLMHNILYK